jgi:hypothetical protein
MLNQKAGFIRLFDNPEARDYLPFFLDASMACLIAKRFFVLCERVFLYLPTPVRRFAICVFY